jgi:hypothetical protein
VLGGVMFFNATLTTVSFPDRLTGESRLLAVRSGHAEIEV